MTSESKYGSEKAPRKAASGDLASGARMKQDIPDEAFSKLLQLVRTVQTGMQSIDGSFGLSGSQLWALWQISAEPGLRVTALAKALHIQPSTASNLLDKLETRGLVRRERLDSDSRVVRLFLTDQGVDLVGKIPGPMRGRLRQTLQRVPVATLQGLVVGLSTVLELMGETPASADQEVS
ncbi:MAG: MarR family transcriptional regulator, partial [Gammaproteobacteria bacterium]|nr:MarR family transcriptional regulator [Gammaproteobacteria bacterium]